MAEVDPDSGIVYLNSAVVPRVRRLPLRTDGGKHGTDGGKHGSSGGGGGAADTIPSHHFLVVELRQGVVAAARDVWVGVQRADGDAACDSTRCVVMREQELVRTSLAAADAAGGPGLAPEGGPAETAAAGSVGSTGGAAAPAADCAEGVSSGAYVCSVYRAHTGEWEPFVLRLPAAAAAEAAAERQLAEVS